MVSPKTVTEICPDHSWSFGVVVLRLVTWTVCLTSLRFRTRNVMFPDSLKSEKQLMIDSSHLHVLKSNFEPRRYRRPCLQEMSHWAINLQRKSSDDELPCEGKAGDCTDGRRRWRSINRSWCEAYIFEFLQMFLYLDVIKRVRSLQSSFHTNFSTDILN